MIHNLAESIAFFYGKKVNYSKDDIDICVYGLEILISDLVVLVISLLIALAMKTIGYTVVLLLVFISLRHQMGGFHASSHFKCNLIFFAAYFAALLGIKTIPYEAVSYVIYILILLSNIVTLKFAPVEHPNRPISKDEKIKFRKRSIVLVLVYSILAIILKMKVIHMEMLALSIAIGVFYVALSVVAEKIKRSTV